MKRKNDWRWYVAYFLAFAISWPIANRLNEVPELTGSWVVFLPLILLILLISAIYVWWWQKSNKDESNQ